MNEKAIKIIRRYTRAKFGADTGPRMEAILICKWECASARRRGWMRAQMIRTLKCEVQQNEQG